MVNYFSSAAGAAAASSAAASSVSAAAEESTDWRVVFTEQTTTLLRSSELKTLEAQLTNLDALAQAKAGNVDVEVLRNVLVRSCNVDLTDGEVHAATITDTLCQTVELNRNANGDRLLVVDLEEVDMQQSVCYRVELQLLEDGKDGSRRR